MSVPQKTAPQIANNSPQLIISLNASGNLIAELPGINGSRRKVDLVSPQDFTYTISNAILALQAVRDLDELNTIASDAAQKAESAKQNQKLELTRRAKVARDAANIAAQRIGDLNQNITSLENLLKKDETTTGMLHRILSAQINNKSKLGEDGAPTQAQSLHWQRHETFSDPSCTFCKSEGRFEPGKNREKAIKNLSIHEALTLGLISRGYKQSKNNPDIFTLGKLGCWISNNRVQDKNKIFWSKSQLDKLIQQGKDYAKQTSFEPQEFKQKTIKLGQGVSVKKTVSRVPVTKSKLKNLSL
jgi:hypothetical protein